MLIVLAAIWLFMLGGMKRELVPGRWQVAVEGVTGFITSMLDTNVGPEGRKYVPWVFTVFIFILFANLIGMMPFAIVPGVHPFTVTSQFTVTGVMAIISFAIVLVVGFWKHGLHFFSLFVPQGHAARPQAPDRADRVRLVPGAPVQPRAATVRGDDRRSHPDRGVRQFRRQRPQRRAALMGPMISLLSFVFIVGVIALELLVCAIQAYVFALLTSLYINDAVNLH